MKKLYIFDMDGTLLDSPLPEAGKKEFERIKGVPYPHSGWWGRWESLMPEFDIKPLQSIMKHYNRATEDFEAGKIMLTNRMYKLKPNILPILAKNKLYFDTHSFKYDNKTKVERALEIMNEKFNNVEEIEFFDDMIEHVLDFARMWDERPDIKLTIHFVSEERDWITIKSKEELEQLKQTL